MPDDIIKVVKYLCTLNLNSIKIKSKVVEIYKLHQNDAFEFFFDITSHFFDCSEIIFQYSTNKICKNCKNQVISRENLKVLEVAVDPS